MTALLTPKQVGDLAEELVARVGYQTEHAVNDWLDQACPKPQDRRRLLLSVASMVPVDPGYKAYVLERFGPKPLPDPPR